MWWCPAWHLPAVATGQQLAPSVHRGALLKTECSSLTCHPDLCARCYPEDLSHTYSRGQTSPKMCVQWSFYPHCWVFPGPPVWVPISIMTPLLLISRTGVPRRAGRGEPVSSILTPAAGVCPLGPCPWSWAGSGHVWAPLCLFQAQYSGPRFGGWVVL